jgi:xanthine/uracil permease
VFQNYITLRLALLFFFPNNKKVKLVKPLSLLVKQYHIVLPLALITYILTNYIIYLINTNNVIESNQFKLNCYYDNEIKPQYIQTLRKCLVGASFSVLFTTLFRTLLSTFSKGNNGLIQVAYLAASVVMFVCFGSELIYHIGILPTVCEDALGVRSPLIEG